MAALRPPPTFHNVRAQRLAQLCRPNDLVIAFSYDRDYLSYYLHRAGFRGRIVSYPSWIDRQVGWVDTAVDLAPGKAILLEEDAVARVQLVESVIAKGGRVFVLGDFLEAVGNRSRVSIAAGLLTALRTAGYGPQLIDSELLIFELTRPGRS